MGRRDRVKRCRVQTLVLCPTRELADEVAVEIRELARGIHNIKVISLCGGMAFGPQVGSLEHGAHIVVGTPGRIEEHLRKANLNLDNLTTLVLDEADRMLDMGFQQALDDIISYMPIQRQTLLFSATYPAKIEQTAQRIMQSPVTVEVQDSHGRQSIVQTLYQVENNQARIEAIRLLLQAHQPETTLIFCNTKIDTDRVASEFYLVCLVHIHAPISSVLISFVSQQVVRFSLYSYLFFSKTYLLTVWFIVPDG